MTAVRVNGSILSDFLMRIALYALFMNLARGSKTLWGQSKEAVYTYAIPLDKALIPFYTEKKSDCTAEALKWPPLILLVRFEAPHAYHEEMWEQEGWESQLVKGLGEVAVCLTKEHFKWKGYVFSRNSKARNDIEENAKTANIDQADIETLISGRVASYQALASFLRYIGKTNGLHNHADTVSEKKSSIESDLEAREVMYEHIRKIGEEIFHSWASKVRSTETEDSTRKVPGDIFFAGLKACTPSGRDDDEILKAGTKKHLDCWIERVVKIYANLLILRAKLKIPMILQDIELKAEPASLTDNKRAEFKDIIEYLFSSMETLKTICSAPESMVTITSLKQCQNELKQTGAFNTRGECASLEFAKDSCSPESLRHPPATVARWDCVATALFTAYKALNPKP